MQKIYLHAARAPKDMVRVTTGIKMDEDLWREFKKHCIEHNIEIAACLEQLIREDLQL